MRGLALNWIDKTYLDIRGDVTPTTEPTDFTTLVLGEEGAKGRLIAALAFGLGLPAARMVEFCSRQRSTVFPSTLALREFNSSARNFVPSRYISGFRLAARR
jgi:hypothetical protein